MSSDDAVLFVIENDVKGCNAFLRKFDDSFFDGKGCKGNFSNGSWSVFMGVETWKFLKKAVLFLMNRVIKLIKNLIEVKKNISFNSF